ncbi:MAG: hypothetical protein QOD81_3040 [Solirubrobacteraceae bacterium]|nr:hypothetical protein [Solirubrobacteraceae bacterium]
MPVSRNAVTRAAAHRARRLLPHGRTLPAEELGRRHRALLVLLWLHVLAVPLWATAVGQGVVHSLADGGAIALWAAAATAVGPRRRLAPVLVAMGLLTASAAIVHVAGGLIEAHFHYFVVIVLLTLYEDWTVFLLAAAYVVVHHGVGGALAPESVFNHPEAETHPWRWAAMHAAFIGAAGLSAIVAWRLNEDLRDQHTGLIEAKQAALERATAAERELARHARELERSNRELQDFASIASHDLSAPLVSVAGFLGLLEDRYAGRLDAEAEEYIAYAIGGTQRMQRLITDLLDYSRAGRAGVVEETVELAVVMRETLEALHATVEETDAQIVVDPLPAVPGDSRQLAQLMQNLVANAMKFTGDARPVVHVTAQAVEDGWEVSVTDTGIGVEPADAERIFEMFSRSAGDVAGTGIGLAICQRIVERHGGRIWVQPAAGGGSAFRFTLPDAGPAGVTPDGRDEADAPPHPAAA